VSSIRRPNYNPLVGDRREYRLRSILPGGMLKWEDFEDLLLAQARARELFEEGIKNDFVIMEITTNCFNFDVRTNKEIAEELIAQKEEVLKEQMESVRDMSLEELLENTDMSLFSSEW
jgi:hypothetical protein